MNVVFFPADARGGELKSERSTRNGAVFFRPRFPWLFYAEASAPAPWEPSPEKRARGTETLTGRDKSSARVPRSERGAKASRIRGGLNNLLVKNGVSLATTVIVPILCVYGAFDYCALCVICALSLGRAFSVYAATDDGFSRRRRHATGSDEVAAGVMMLR